MVAPVRTCIGCRRAAEVTVLMRVGRSATGGLELGSRVLGRGAWLCSGSRECFTRARRARAFPRALRVEVDELSLDTLESLLAECFGERQLDMLVELMADGLDE